jgi:hypothetical protein
VFFPDIEQIGETIHLLLRKAMRKHGSAPQAGEERLSVHDVSPMMGCSLSSFAQGL